MAAPNLPTQMRSAQWTTVPMESSLKLNPATPLPKDANPLPKDSALIKVSYASLNPVDYKVSELGLARWAAMGKGPWIPAGDYAGTVVATNLPHLKPGDKVAGVTGVPKFGALGEYAVVNGAANVTKIPEGVDLKDAATLGIAGLTALQCIAPYVHEGSKVVVNGASGGTGTFGVQIAKILGCSVTAICSGPNVEFCKSLGADKVIDYKTSDVVQELEKGGLQYDLIVDNVAMGAPFTLDRPVFSKRRGILAQPTWLGGVRRRSGLVTTKQNGEEITKLASWVRDGKLKPSIEKVYNLEEAADAFKRLKSQRTRGKLVIKVSEN